MSARPDKKVTLRAADGSRHDVERLDDAVVVDGQVIRLTRLCAGHYRAGGRAVWATAQGDEVWVFIDGRIYSFVLERPAGGRRAAAPDHAGHSAPMPATVTRIQVAPGDRVRAGDVIATLEAMKMELPIRAAADGVVRTVACRVGELVQPGRPLVEIEAAG